MKNIIKRKLPYLLFFLLSFPAFLSALGQEPLITLKYNKASFRTVLKEIEKQSSMSVVYNTADVEQNRSVAIKVNKESLSHVMSRLLKGTNLAFSVINNHIILSVKGQKKEGQERIPLLITGQVTDTAGEPLIGVNVQVKGSFTGTITDMNGLFKLQAAKGELLVISYIGYASQTVSLNNVQPLKIVLGEDAKVLDEVVITALGIRRSQKALSYNVQEVKGEQFTTVKDANFMNSLSGKVAGVNINASASGMGGATRVIMRGTKSLSASNNALYVIDGIPIFNTNNGDVIGEYAGQPRGEGISDINPEDIESMSVLSGPAAAALYGSNAAQGVILITTKKGSEGKVKITISNNTTFSQPFIMPEFQNSYMNKAQEFKSWGENGKSQFGDYNSNEFFNTGSNVQNTISLSVGNNQNQTYFSAGTTNANGLIPNSQYNRYNFTVRNTTKFLNDKMTFDFGFSYIIQNDKNLMAQGQYFNPLTSIYLYPRGENFDLVRMYKTYDMGRKIDIQNWSWGSAPGYSMITNPYWIANNMNHGTQKQRYMANASLKYQILDWLDVLGRVRIDNATSKYEDKRDASTDLLWTAGSDYGFYRYDKSDDRQVYADVIVNINTSVKDFSIVANVGASITQTYFDQQGFQGGLKEISNVYNMFNLNTTQGKDQYPVQNFYKKRTNSLFASVEVGWKSMLYLTITGRNDWDSALANTEKLAFFYPSIGFSGVITEMVKLPDFVSYLKVRGSFASVGSAIPRNLTSPWSYAWDPDSQKWTTKTYRPLPKLYPEKTDSWEAGVSAKFFDNKLSLDLTWYKSNTKKQTFSVPISAGSGYSSMYAQSGDVQNTGMEFSLGFNNKWGNFGWSSNVTYSFNNNKIVELLDDYEDTLTGERYSLSEIDKGGVGSTKIVLRKGGSMGDLYVTTQLKRDQQGNIFIDPVTNKVVKETLKGDGIQKVGSILPKSNLGFRNDFTYKGINFGFMLTARFGGVVASQTQAIMDEYGVSKTSAIARDNGGVEINNGKIDAKEYYTIVGGSEGVMSHYIYNATNVRLQEVVLGYTLPAKWFNNKLSMSLSVVGRNLWMIYNKAPFDPEVTASTGTYYQGFDFFMQPSLRNYGFNVKFQF